MSVKSTQTLAPTGTAAASTGEIPLLARVALLAGFVLVWIVQHIYKGIFHDSQLYTLPAVARIHPELLGNDIMLRLGSQDSFTIFSPLYAAAIRLLGVDWAAAALTLLWQVAFFVAAAMLVRRLMPARPAWISLVLLCAIPAFYGKGTTFTVMEDFVTPRLIAEALVLAGLTCVLARRYWLATVCALVAASLHPLMAGAGVAVAFFLIPVTTRTRTLLIAGAALTGTIMLGVLAARGAQLTFDPAWLRLLEAGTDYLFVKAWTIGSISRAVVMLGTLVIGIMVLEKSPARTLCAAALLTAVGGTVFSFVGGDLLHLVPVVQVQLWRWNWIANLFAVLLLPLILMQAWSKGVLWRTGALLLEAAWLCLPEIYALEIMVLVMIVYGIARLDVTVSKDVGRKVFFGGCALLGLAILYHVATSILFASAVPDQSDVSPLLQQMRGVGRSGVLSFTAFLLFAALVFRARTVPARAALAACAVVLLAAALPSVGREWTRQTYTGEPFQAFAGWREQIPVGTEVLWFDSPVSSWLLLQRPSYLSNQQMSSGLFSRPAAMEMKSRVDRLAVFLQSESAAWLDESDRRKPQQEEIPVSLADLCAAAKDVKFVVTQKNVSATPVATTPLGVSNRYKGAQLYRCPHPEG